MLKFSMLIFITSLGFMSNNCIAQTSDTVRNQNLANNINSETSYEKFTISGRKSTFDQFYDAKLNCSPTDWMEVSIATEPQHGSAKIIEQQLIMTYASPNPRTSCNGKSILGKVLEYSSEKGYKGEDYMTVEVINDTGQMIKRTYKITVK